MAKVSATLSLPVPPIFELESEGSTNSVRWTEWIRRFNRYIKAAQIADDGLQIDTMLVCAGDQIEQIYHQQAVTTHKFEDVVKVITNHFAPYTDTDSNIVAFRNITQRMNENIESYMVRLRQAALLCEFKDRLDQ